MNREDDGISEIVSEIMIILMVLMLAVIIAVLVFGAFKPVDKTAYLVPQFNLSTMSGKTVITIFDRGGEPVYFNGSPLAKYKAVLYVDTQSGSYNAVPAPSLTVFKPGDMIYAYYTGSGFILTNSISGLTFPSLPGGKLTVRFVDATSGVLIAKEDLVNGAVTTTTTTAPVTTTVTTTATTSVTTTATTVITTTVPSTYPVTVSWVPKGSGANAAGTVSPPGTNDAIVNVAAGSTQVFTATPKTGNRVSRILLDGVQVSAGGTTNQVVTYTLTNVQASHTLTVHFQ